MSRLIPSRPGRLLVALAVLAALAPVAGCSSEHGGRTPGPAPTGDRASPAAESPFWVDPDSPAAQQVQVWEREGRNADAQLLRRIADRPAALWPSGNGDPAPAIRQATSEAREEGRTTLLVAYNIPHRDCGQHSAGGAVDANAYRQWMESFASALGDSRALVILEPDAVAHMADGCTPAALQGERKQLLGEAIDRLKRQPGTKVYLDAGNPAWIQQIDRLAGLLRESGVMRADGFSLNVSNFQTNEATKAYGLRLSQQLGGMHFVVDTSRNGRGPLNGAGGTAWCNPPGRALGTPPTTRTGEPTLDAYLWIKRPGESDGQCGGGPAAGRWWPDYALALARNSTA